MKIRSPFVTRLAARLAVCVGKLLFKTLRPDYASTVHGAYHEHPEAHFIYVTWHDSLLPPILTTKVHNVVALISQHQDGSYLASAMEYLGIRPVRGSSSRGGARAVRQLLDSTREQHIFLTPDGPRGPRREMKPGTVFLASQTGRPIVCCGLAVENAWTIRGNWTDLIVPKPFTRYVMRLSDPIHVPPNLSREELMQFTRRVETAMNDTYEHCERVLSCELRSNSEPTDSLGRAA